MFECSTDRLTRSLFTRTDNIISFMCLRCDCTFLLECIRKQRRNLAWWPYYCAIHSRVAGGSGKCCNDFFCQDFFLWILLVGHVMVARSSYQSSIQFTASSRGEQSHSVVYVLHTEELNELRSMNPWFGGSAMFVCLLQLLPPLLLPGCYFLLPCTFPREAGFAPPMSSLGARWVYLHVEWWKEANDLFAAPLDWLWCRSWYFVWCWAVSCFHSFVIDKGTW